MLQRRSYWLLSDDRIVLVHYLVPANNARSRRRERTIDFSDSEEMSVDMEMDEEETVVPRRIETRSRVKQGAEATVNFLACFTLLFLHLAHFPAVLETSCKKIWLFAVH